MSKFTSYAQNFEDVLLWRALQDVQGGRYIDIGAQSPMIDSVSRLFHERGWVGIHVEPVAEYAQQLRDARPGDTVLQVAVSDHFGIEQFYRVPNSGLSTLDAATAEAHIASGLDVSVEPVSSVTLDSILEGCGSEEIHWLKIDVEGKELDVLRGWERHPARPWIVLVESTVPLSKEPAYQDWEPFLLRKGYVFASFDGLNRFYVRGDRPDLREVVGYGPNVFDDFTLSSASIFCEHVNLAYKALQDHSEAELARRDELIRMLEEEAVRTRAELEGRAEEELRSRDELIVSLQSATRLLVGQFEALRDERTELAKRTAALETEAAARKASLAQLEDRAGGLAEEVARWEAVARDEGNRAFAADARIWSLEDIVGALKHDIAMHETEVGALAQALDRALAERTSIVDRVNGQLAAALADLDREKHESHRWWREAEALRGDLAGIAGSRSWRYTGVLRNAWRRIDAIALGLKRDVVRPLLLRLVGAYVSNAKLRQLAAPVIAATPGMRGRLRSLARSENMLPGLPQGPSHISATRIAPFTSIPELGPRAARVLEDLLDVLRSEVAE